MGTRDLTGNRQVAVIGVVMEVIAPVRGRCWRRLPRLEELILNREKGFTLQTVCYLMRKFRPLHF